MKKIHSRIRTFIAVPLFPAERDQLQTAIKPLIKQWTHLRWLPPENWHLTLRFLGDVTPEALEILRQATAKEAKETIKFKININKIDTFPPEKLRLLVAYIERQEHLSQLFFNLDQAAEKAGLAREERLFLPHITLAKSRRPIRHFDPLDCDLSIHAEELVIFESRPTNDGSQYVPLYKFQFSLH
ncbi:RNA 2',3'-cyclic phosphodiesterase [Coxiella burnetii]|uniref:RNA 2',3'-cyclic phosphodiesterase n=1 Tax=Coxiella burnetii (strain RSA 493 / Nine Mile phase I) TaxID=227377 RepID=Q83CP4_COXBU|nr:RNA 2',3'-cyclic phosphodiesterase [Coxiella burnetii]NP_820065.1 2'-5' RNA ligase [Coxiella burnetii RSA 493]AAO90579.1 2'-5' RNA ligase [Coxiella burnetii RSA 493]ARI65880.1 2'-5' RNA ligase [Coxiella burnetii]ARK27346.1 2'-5' RNA ligase [Coxiella burnetii]MCF2094634.1 RNA 2',3'-cyclic phosphodiesterase [Coxiella burnetii]MCF2096660.1 RNA 2',3'-cyclic phosphodiesterase [Coxiella burnetii]